MSRDTEIWKPVIGFEGFYEVSTHGLVRSLSRQVPTKGGGVRTVPTRILRPGVITGGYFGITLHANGKRREATVHMLVAEAFLGPRPSPLHEVNHINAVKPDNRVENLEWVTRQANIAHNVALGINLRGSALPQAKLTEADITPIRRRVHRGERHAQIALDFGVSKAAISDIARGITWKHVPIIPGNG